LTIRAGHTLPTFSMVEVAQLTILPLIATFDSGTLDHSAAGCTTTYAKRMEPAWEISSLEVFFFFCQTWSTALDLAGFWACFPTKRHSRHQPRSLVSLRNAQKPFCTVLSRISLAVVLLFLPSLRARPLSAWSWRGFRIDPCPVADISQLQELDNSPDYAH
jgi:hypothetical protein